MLSADNAIGSAVRFACLLPDRRFRQLPDQCFQTRRSFLFQTGPDTRNGLSLPRNRCPLRSPGSGIEVPSLLLPVTTCCVCCPFGPSAPRPVPVRPGSGRITASGPLQYPLLAALAVFPVSAPLRDFCLPRDQSVPLDPQSLGPPAGLARLPLAPRRPFYH